MGTINHRHVTTLPDNPNADISSDEWNDALVIRGTDADGFVLTRDATQPDGWRFAPLPTVDLSGVVPITRTVNAHPLSADVVVTKADVGLGNVENTALSTWSGSTSITTIGTLTDQLSIGTNPATTGAIRISNAIGAIRVRNQSNTGDIELGQVYSDDNLYLGQSSFGVHIRPSGKVFIEGVGDLVVNSSLSIGTNPASAGAIRLANNQALSWRNGANTGDYSINLNVSNQIVCSGAAVIANATNSVDLGAAGVRWRNVFVSSSVVNKVKAGTPTDADVVVPTDGMMLLDSTANKIWVRLGGTWKGVAVT